MRQTSMPMMIMMIRNTRTKGIAITKKWNVKTRPTAGSCTEVMTSYK
jgi:hypothetical protein